jgi:hypothetical protein
MKNRTKKTVFCRWNLWILFAISKALLISACAGESGLESVVIASPPTVFPKGETKPEGSKYRYQQGRKQIATRGEWRITTVLEAPVGVVWCPMDSDFCEQIHGGRGFTLRNVVRSPDRQGVAFFQTNKGDSVKGDSCEFYICVEQMCGSPVDSVCNPNNSSLRWLPSGSLLYRGSGGSGISVGALYGRDGRELWSSVYVADELSPSMRYLLVGYNSSHQVFAAIDSIQILDLETLKSVEKVPVPPGKPIRAVWVDGGVQLKWSGGGRKISLKKSGKPGNIDLGWQPFSK